MHGWFLHGVFRLSPTRADAAIPVRIMSYAELHCLTNFSFLRGASHPEELVERAASLGYAALAHHRRMLGGGRRTRTRGGARSRLQLIVGGEFRIDDGLSSYCLRQNRRGYAQLCRLITRGRRAAAKGSYRLQCSDFASVTDVSAETAKAALVLDDCLALWLPEHAPDDLHGRWLAGSVPATFVDRRGTADERPGPSPPGRAAGAR